MAASPMIDKQEDTQTRSNGIKTTTLLIPTPRALPSLQRFQDVTKRIVSASTRRSSTGMNCNAPPLPSSDSRSSNSSKVRRYSFSNVVACATNGVNHTSSQCTARLSNTGKDCQNLLSADAADDVNRRCSHLGASSTVTSHGGSHHVASNSKLKYGSSLPSSSRFSHPNTSSSNHAFSHVTSSSDMVNHGSLHPTSSKNDLTRHISLQSATLEGNDTGFENQRSGLSNGAHAGGEQIHCGCCMTKTSQGNDAGFENQRSGLSNGAQAGCCMTEPSFPNPNVGLTSHSSLQGKLASKNLTSTPSELSESRAAATKTIAKATETYKKSHAGVRDSATKHRTNELCQNCRTSISMMESVCFIANDGRISAAKTGASYARHDHHCNVRGCPGNQRYRQSPSFLSRTDSPSKREAPLNPQPTKRKSHTLSGIGDHGRRASSVQGDYCRKQEMELSLRGSTEMLSSIGSETLDMKKELMKCSEGDENCGNTNSLGHTPIDGNGVDVVSPCKERSPSPLMTQIPKDQQSYVENTHVENVEVQSSPAALCISSDIHDDDDKGFAYRDDIQALNDLKCLLSYHGDTEYSCSENGTEATTTPDSLSKDAFDDLSNIDIEQSNCENELSRSRKSTMARMRKKYLESLTEQEADKVRLRKQEIMARKQAGDWMLDCHMEEVLHRLAPSGEARVKVLVEAFETVMNQSDSDSSQTAHHQDQEHVENLHSHSSS